MIADIARQDDVETKTLVLYRAAMDFKPSRHSMLTHLVGKVVKDEVYYVSYMARMAAKWGVQLYLRSSELKIYRIEASHAYGWSRQYQNWDEKKLWRSGEKMPEDGFTIVRSTREASREAHCELITPPELIVPKMAIITYDELSPEETKRYLIDASYRC
jgi:hypothetical protein